MPRYGLPLQDLPHRAFDAVEAAERGQGCTVLLRDSQPVAALVSIEDLNRADPPDPGMGGVDPLLGLCGASRLDWFVEQVMAVYGVRTTTGGPLSTPVPSMPEGAPAERPYYDAPLPTRPR